MKKRAGIQLCRIMTVVLSLHAAFLLSARSPGVTAQEASGQKTFTNPILRDVADPYILQEGNLYYLYGTNSAGTGFKPYTSTDLVNWTLASDYCLSKGSNTWGATDFWAPEVYKINGVYYLIYSAAVSSGGPRNVYVASSQSPFGPFVKYGAGPLVSDAIDATLFTDSDGSMYLYYRYGQQIYGAQVNASLTQMISDAKLQVTKNGQPWLLNTLVEGPEMLKHNGYYYLFFSGNDYKSTYALGYATSKNPLGPYTKSDQNPVMSSAGALFCPGHNGFAYSPDGSQLYTVYSLLTNISTVSRGVGLDRVRFISNGSGPDIVQIDGPTASAQSLPNGAQTVESSVAAGQTTKSDDHEGAISSYGGAEQESSAVSTEPPRYTESPAFQPPTEADVIYGYEVSDDASGSTAEASSAKSVVKKRRPANSTNIGVSEWIVGGVLAAVALAVLALFFLCRMRKKKGIPCGFFKSLRTFWRRLLSSHKRN